MSSRHQIVGLVGLVGLALLGGCVEPPPEGGVGNGAAAVASIPDLAEPPPGATCALIQRGTLGQAQDSDIGFGNGADYSMGALPYSWTGVSPYDHWSAYQFDLSPVPANANVVLGVFSSYAAWNQSSATIRAHRIVNAWDESNVTWSSFTNDGAITNWDPAVLGSADAYEGGYLSFDVTGLVQQWHGGAVANNGILLEEDPVLVHSYFTSEASTVSIRPSLYVCWVAGGIEAECSDAGGSCDDNADCCDGLSCQGGTCAAPLPDVDGDGVTANNDCDDNNPLIGGLLYENNMSVDTGYLTTGPKLTDPWAYGGGAVSNTEGGQQALLGQAEGWTNTVTFVTLSANGSKSGCFNDSLNCNPERFRAGVLSRSTIDADQDEGFHGYRCAVAFNAAENCFDPGPFVQIAAFLDGPEDDIQSECVVGCAPNPTFDQLARVERSTQTDLLAGDSATLTFWSVGNSFVCAFDGENGEHVVASATDDRFAAGGTGLSTLNALGEFDQVKVCQAFGTP